MPVQVLPQSRNMIPPGERPATNTGRDAGPGSPASRRHGLRLSVRPQEVAGIGVRSEGGDPAVLGHAFGRFVISRCHKPGSWTMRATNSVGKAVRRIGLMSGVALIAISASVFGSSVAAAAAPAANQQIAEGQQPDSAPQ